ncbi:tRNA (adenosine(37)-N6)-threonylcarbamoyltransferase complex dimerization subunit type 1 TsaB [Pseudogemmobacter humi]|uniref:tRNA threonylcarbamoyladenosine biosynthesis protein TsaB n=1 Tax=Pseudogemmobacter humi TaxID=2483812 RepID=A0A3P5XPW1_9RHOB|nr:tRNA (adenosine(37)-N6)-threonylcarbamoyltransferase complex dimerization subunit type 1 TsaB [Pseudogemmobacter humi]VDC32880.1 tRNA threonylcarbamoyladenosine biosynthesis protein TsaB [Pseudogemmobacter humi]
MAFSRPLLAFDTSAAHCAAALVTDGRTFAGYEPMQKGQAERLIPLLDAMLAGAGLGWRDLGGLAVGIGPGNFTGVRIAVSAARGLALGLGLPLAGISAFELMRGSADGGPQLVSLAAPRDQAYVQSFRGGQPQGRPRLIDPGAPPADLAIGPGTCVIGHRAAQIARPFGAEALEAETDDLPARLAAIAARKFASGEIGPLPAPLYVRPADAAPPSDPPPVILDA